MPLFVAAAVVARRNRRPTTITIPLTTPALWRMLLEEVAITVQRPRKRLAHRARRSRSSNGTHHSRGGTMTTTAPPETFAGGADRQGLEDRRATLLRHLHLNRDDFDATEELRSVERALARLPRPEGIWAWQRREQRRGAQ